MHRETDIARWYRRVDQSCFTTQHPSDAALEAHPLFASEIPDDAVRARRDDRVGMTPGGWLGNLARRLNATGV